MSDAQNHGNSAEQGVCPPFFCSRIGAIVMGLVLGMLSPAQLRAHTQRYYSRGGRPGHIDYTAATYNRSGLMPWERRLIDRFFPSHGSIIVGGAGGGREVLALSLAGFAVDGFECHADLAEAGNRILEEERVGSRISLVEPNRVLRTAKRYDAAIIGWTALSHVQTRARRTVFLQSLRELCLPAAPLLLSVQPREAAPLHFALIYRIANAVRSLRRAERVEEGDVVGHTYAHMFDRVSLSHELSTAGWSLLHYEIDGEDGIAVARADGAR
jgi:hypothetical protein